MRRACRGDSWIRCVPALLLSAACGERPVPEPTVAHTARPERPRSALVEEAARWPPAFPPFVSRGHGDGRFTIDIRVAPTALDAFRDLVLGQVMPAGTVVVAFHTLRGSDARGSAYAMQKRADGAWDFVVADSQARVVESGSLPLCVRCHAEAPADSLFVPRPRRREDESP